MHLNILLIAAILNAILVTSDFIIVTDTSWPTHTAAPSLQDLDGEIAGRTASWVVAQGESVMASVAAAESDLDMFARTATYSIPSEVTNFEAMATFMTIPDWWTALPSNVRQEKEMMWGVEKSVRSEVYADAAPTKVPGAVNAGLAVAVAAGAVFL